MIIPTYNERRTLPHTLRRTRSSAPEAEVLVVDDASPDGTGQWAEGAAAHDPQVHVLHHGAKTGLGRAYVAGFTWALERGYDLVVEMDADGSHHPEDLPRLLDQCDGDTPLVIGSRWVEGGRTQNWPLLRRVLSRGANRYANAVIGLDVADATAGFRVFTADLLRRIDLAAVDSQGYCFQVDMTRRVRALGEEILELPITFTERLDGSSKMNRAIVAEALVRTTVWGAQRRAQQCAAWVQALRRRS